MKINTCFLLVKNTTKFLITGILLYKVAAAFILKSLKFSSSGGRQLSCQREVDAIRSTLLLPSLTLLTEDYIIIIIVSKVLPNQFICTVCPLHNSLIYSLNAQGHTQFSKVQPITNELSRTCWRPKIVYQQYVCAYIPLPQSSK
jgi:hypothetical protein